MGQYSRPFVPSPCETDLWEFHGGVHLFFNKTWKPTSVHIYYQFLLYCLSPLSSRFTSSWGEGGISVCCLSTKLGLSHLRLIWTAFIAHWDECWSLLYAFPPYLVTWSILITHFCHQNSLLHIFTSASLKNWLSLLIPGHLFWSTRAQY